MTSPEPAQTEAGRPTRSPVGPGGDPIITGSEAGSEDAPEQAGPPLSGTVLDCGWGRLVFGQTFAEPDDVVDVLRAEAAGARDICIYLADPHVLVSRRSDELFIDPSLTFRLPLPAPQLASERSDTIEVRSLAGPEDAEAVNAIYARNSMLTAPVTTLVDNARSAAFLHLVATGPRGAVVGTVTGVDHAEAFGDPDDGASLWCLTVDPASAPPGTGQALLAELARRLTARGRRYVDLSVLAENQGAIRLYERLGFARTRELCVKRKTPINEKLFRPIAPAGYDELNPYAKIVADEAMRRGIKVDVLDPSWGELRLTHGGRVIVTRESLSELTTAVAMSRCDDKRVTRRILVEAGLSVPRGRDADGSADDDAFLDEVGTVVVKPARGEQGAGITVGVSTYEDLVEAVALARSHCPDVLIEELHTGEDLRVIVIGHEVVAAAVRRPAEVVGDGRHSIADLIARQSRRREAATGGESRIPLDEVTRAVVIASGHSMDDVLPPGEPLAVRRTANLHTGGTIHDVTAELHPDLAAACVAASRALSIPVTGLDLLVRAADESQHVFIEANERPGLANHEPQPTTQRFVDLLFPGTSSVAALWVPAGSGPSAGQNAGHGLSDTPEA